MMSSMPSQLVFIAWELGGGLGHLVRALPLVQRFRQRGYRVSLAARDLSRVARIFGRLEVRCFQAPVKTTRAENRVETPRSFAHILHNGGYGDDVELRGLAEAWWNLFEAVRPGLLLCDHSPTALLAAAGMGFRTATPGTGLCCTPGSDPFPDFRLWLPDEDQRRRDEDAVLGRVNRLLESWGSRASTGWLAFTAAWTSASWRRFASSTTTRCAPRGSIGAPGPTAAASLRSGRSAAAANESLPT